jgi:hypothetical protein
MASVPVPMRMTPGEGMTSFVRTFVACDLADRDGHDAPSRGMGVYLDFSFTETAPHTQADYVLTVTSPGGSTIESEADDSAVLPPGRRFRALSARLKALDSETRPLSLSVCGRRAYAEADAETWEKLTEPVMLVVAQVWRLQDLESRFDELSAQARLDVGARGSPSLFAPWRGRRLNRRTIDARKAIFDLTRFQGVVADPRAHASSPRSARDCDRLIRRLHLEAWSLAIDERAEVVEAFYEAISDKIYYRNIYVVEVILEIMIILILLSDVALHFFW